MESRSFLHCDVAARNVLLFTPTASSHPPHPVAKLGDFGLAFRLRPTPATNGNHNHDYEDLDVLDGGADDETCSFAFSGSQRMASNVTQIPIKWTAPESIRTRVGVSFYHKWSSQILLHMVGLFIFESIKFLEHLRWSTAYSPLNYLRG